MWPDEHASWRCSPRHAYLQSCEQQRLLPHPRLLQFTDAVLQPVRDTTGAQSSFVAPFGFIAEQTFLGDAGLEAAIPLIKSVLARGGERGKQLHLVNVGITHNGMRSLGQHVQTWSAAPNSRLSVVDVDFSHNSMSNASVQCCSVCYLQPLLRATHLRRLVLSGCKYVAASCFM